MPYCPIVGTLGYILSPDQERVLMIHRIARNSDDHFGKYNGVGGKMEPNEDVVTCMHREIREETGLEVEALTLRGTVNWTNFGPHGEDWLGFLFLITKYRGTPFTENEEGTLAWHPINTIMDLPMWDGDRHFLPLMFDGDPRTFHGYMPYNGNNSKNWTYIRI